MLHFAFSWRHWLPPAAVIKYSRVSYESSSWLKYEFTLLVFSIGESRALCPAGQASSLHLFGERVSLIGADVREVHRFPHFEINHVPEFRNCFKPFRIVFPARREINGTDGSQARREDLSS
jgi:hypothetical protein